MIILNEDIVAYNKDDIYDMVENSTELSDFSKDLICDFVDNCSVQLSGIDHQMTRQPLTPELYKDAFDTKSEFVKLIKYLTETDIESRGQIDKALDNFFNLVKVLIDKVNPYVSISTQTMLEKHCNDLEVIISKFKTYSLGLVDGEESNTTKGHLLQINEFDTDASNQPININKYTDEKPKQIKQNKAKPIKKYRLVPR